MLEWITLALLIIIIVLSQEIKPITVTKVHQVEKPRKKRFQCKINSHLQRECKWI